MVPCDTLEVAGHFYLVYYEADSSGSPSHKCITVNHNIPRHPVRPWRMTAWHHNFPSKNMAFKRVKSESSIQHRCLTWNPFTELFGRFRVDLCSLLRLCLGGSLNSANLGWQIKEGRPLKRLWYFLRQEVLVLSLSGWPAPDHRMKWNLICSY